MTDYKELCALSIKAAEHSYSPYSNYRVGAALKTKSGKIFVGCNVENAAFSECICAERTAFVKALSEGERRFSVIAVVALKNGEIDKSCVPCGACRQVMSEFCTPDFEIVLVSSEDEYRVVKIEELIPNSFGKANLN